MSNWFELFIRIVGFGATLYFLLEYILTCKVDTNIGLLTTLFATIVVLLIFKFYTCKYVSRCGYCQNNVIKKTF